MNPQDDNTTDDRFRNPQSPDPLQNSPQGSDVNDDLGQKQSIPSDQDVDPDPDLQTYQDDIKTGEQEDRVQYEQHADQPADVLPGMNEGAIKSELDNTAMSEQEYSPDQHGSDNTVDHATADDIREHVEDMDENDKDHLTDNDSWTTTRS